MSGVWTRLQLPDGTLQIARPGSLIGRHIAAAVRINDPRLSEVHALLSLRGRQLKILSQRALIRVDGALCAEAALKVGQQIALVEGLSLSVVDVSLPAEVLVLEAAGLPAVELSAPVYSLLSRPRPRLLPSFLPGAAMHLWSNDDGWTLELDGAPSRPVAEGASWTAAGVEMRIRSLPLRQAGTQDTRASQRNARPMRILARYETVHVEREGLPTVVLTGIPARIISELAAFDAPTPWEMVADLIWPDDDNALRKRQNWDRTTRRLRRKLREAGLPTDLVRADGRGNVELVLRAVDQLIDAG